MCFKISGLLAGDLMECQFYDGGFTFGFIRGAESLRFPNGDRKQCFRGNKRAALDLVCFIGELFDLYPNLEKKSKDCCYYKFYPRG